PDAAPGAVVEQFPEPYAVAEPGAPVDLVLSESPEDEPDAPGDTASGPATASEPDPKSDTDAGDEADDEPRERLGDRAEPIALEEVSGIGPTYAGRLREEGVQRVSRLAALDPDTVAKITRASTSRAEDWIEEAKRMAAAR
ncbi:helix-hairpin-helix domain-containing protein, partial [Halorubrum kocurii]